MGTLYGHVAKANPQWREVPVGEAMAIFMGPDAYVTPSWYEGKSRDGKVVPTWNYVAVHIYGPVEFFEDADRLLDVVTRLTDLHEASHPRPWAVSDAPPDFIQAQLRGIVGVRLPITRIDAKRKMSQNRKAEDRANVKEGLSGSDDAQGTSSRCSHPGMTSDRTVRNKSKAAAADIAKGIGSGAGAWETLPMIQFPPSPQVAHPAISDYVGPATTVVS